MTDLEIKFLLIGCSFGIIIFSMIYLLSKIWILEERVKKIQGRDE